MYYVVLDGVFKLYSCSRGPLGELTEATAKELTSRKRVVLTDLSTYGTHLLGVLAGWGHSPKVFGVNMEIMRMEVGGCTFKNARLFGIKLSHDWAAVGRCVLELELFMYKCGGLKVSDRGVCSLVSASTALIKGLGGGVRIPYGSELDSELGR